MNRLLQLTTFTLALLVANAAHAQTYTWYQDSDGDGWGNPNVSTTSSSKPSGYVQNNLDCNDAVSNSATWTLIGASGISAYTASYTAIGFDGSDVPYVGYNDNGNGATVYKYSSSAWSMVGSQYFMGQPQYSSIAFDGSGNPYFAAQNNNSSQAPTVMKYASGSWSMLGGSTPTSDGSSNNNLAIDASGNIYFAYKELYSTYANKLTVVKYDGSSWSVVGSRGFSPGTVDYVSLALNASGTPYVAFRDGNSANKATVMSYNGSTWSVVGSDGFSSGGASHLSITIDRSGTPYVAYSGNSGSNKLTVKKYDGSSWSTVGSTGFSAGAATNITIRTDNAGVPYVGYTDAGNSSKATLMKYNGSSWTAVVSAGFTSGSAEYLSFALDSKGVPYVAYQDGANSSRLAVMKLAPAVNPATTPVITSTPIFSCYTGTVNLTVASGTLNDAIEWKWYSGSCGGTYIGSGTTLTTSVTATTTFYARGENLCAASAGACGYASTTLKSSPTWYQDSDGDGWGNPSVAYANCGQPSGYVANNLDCNDATTTGTQWYTLGSGPASAVQCEFTAIAIDANNDAYVGFYDNYTKGTVSKFSGGSWNYYGSSNFTASSTQHNSLAFDQDGTTLYMAYQDGFSGTSVMKNTGSGWTSVGSANFSAGQASYQTIAVAPSGNPYVAYKDLYWMYSNKASVMRYNGSAWEAVGTFGFSAGSVDYISMAIDGGGTPYVAFSDGANSNKLTVMKYNGSSWVIVGSAGVSAGSASYCKIALDLYGMPYVVYRDGSNSNKASVMKYSGSTWSQVGSAGFSSGSVTYTSIALDAGGNPFVVFSDGANSNKATVMKYSGGSWSVYGSAGISSGTATYTNIAVDNYGLPVIAFRNNSGTSPDNTPTVMKVGPVATAPGTPSISASLSTVACGNSTVLSASGSLNGAGNWYWYNGSCGGTPVAVGGTVTVTPTGSTTYYARGWGGCLTTPGACGSTSITVTAGTPSIPAITGTAPTCIGSVRTLANATSGGTWSSSNTAVATVGTSGTVTAVGTGNATISYNWGGTCGSATVTTPVTINPSPGYNAITGTALVTVGSTTTLANATSGGTWSSANSYLATVGSSTGVVTGLAPGWVNISYTISNSCGTNVATTLVTVNPASSMPAISGPSEVCAGATTTLSNTTTGGTWSSSNTSVATVNSSTGEVTGVSGGNVTITYTAGGNSATKAMTVNPLADAGTINGTANVCVGATTTLSNASGGGVWSSSNNSVATVGTNGVVSGIASGNATISYAVTNGCGTQYATKVVTVNPLADAGTITGTASVCVGATTTLSNATGGGVWSSSNSSVATVGTNGVVSGVASGNATVSYAVTNGCGTQYATKVVTVNPLADAGTITGTASVCVSATTTLSNAAGGGVWSSSNNSVATVGTNGVVSGIASGNATVSYAVTNGCGTQYATKVVTVNPLADAGTITGTASVCVSATTTLSNATGGGVWSSSNSSVATVGTNGVVSGIASGNATVSYAVTNGCGTQYATKVVTVNTTPASITGPAFYCVGSAAAVSSATTGGVWSSSNATKAYVNSSTGVVQGMAVGTAMISYTLGSCYAVSEVTVNVAVATITGPSKVCLGDNITFGNADGGGTWSVNNSSLATVNSATGNVVGIGVGNPVVSYNISAGCYATRVVPVNSLPLAISGISEMCSGGYTTMTSTVGGSGAWSSSDTSVATVQAVMGIVTGVSGGTATITYRVSSTGCYRTKDLTVNPSPATIGGSSTICLGSEIAYTNSVTGGTWSSSRTSVATVGSSTGIVSGVAGGGANIIYRLPTGCYIVKAVTVAPTPASITGATSMCMGGSISLSSSTTGGTWTSGNTSVATIGSTGVVTSVAPGTTTISYTVGTGCTATMTLTVNAGLPANDGNAELCTGATSALSNATTGGSWTSSNPAFATVNYYSGLVTGVAAGTALISYRVGTTCMAITEVTVGSTPAAITGPANVCVGSSMTLSHVSSGGTWSSSNTARATVDATTGEVTGVAYGMVNISYTVSEGCVAARTIIVKNLPSAIAGTLTVCEGQTTALSGSSVEMTWYASTPSVAYVNALTGVVTGVSTGTSTITYMQSSGCFTTAVVTVQSLPASIDGSQVLCSGTSTTLTYGPGGGTWSSSNTSIATIGSSTGVLNGIAGGTATITYRLTSGCRSTVVVTVGATPSAISGPSPVCEGSLATFTNSLSGGAWSSSSPAIATVNADGQISAISTGTATITFERFGCVVTKDIVVDPSPQSVSGTNFMCIGGTSTYINATPGGTWSSSSANVTIGSSTGVAAAVTPGTANISYTISNGCYSVTQVTVNTNLPAITGWFKVCVGQSTELSHSTPGGTWSSGNTARATIDAATGLVTGVSVGSVNITYSIGSGCYAVLTMQVYGLPDPITGATNICEGSYTSLTSTIGGSGTWTSVDTGIATVGIYTGLVTGVSAGAVMVSYKVNSTGCYVTRTMSVIAAPAAISGPAVICTGVPATFSSATTGATWSSSNGAVATIGSTGIATGVAGGGTTISYTGANGCYATKAVTVSPSPTAIAGSSTICVGNSVSLSVASGGGSWSTSAPSVVTVSGTGSVSGIATGTSTVVYTNSTSGCTSSVVVTVNSAVSGIEGPSTVCIGNAGYFTCATGGGTWSSSNYAALPVYSASGIAVGYAAGTSTLSYRVSEGCIATTNVTVNTSLPSITGTPKVCVGQTASFANSAAGGAWSVSNEAVATVNATTGVVTGVAAGAVTLSYSTSGGCYVTMTVIVNALPAPITGTTTLCVGGYTGLTSTIGGSGTWSSSNTAVATVNTSGILIAVAPGTSTISYRVASTGCFVVREVTVNTTPAAISGSSSVCVGSTEVYTNSISGGTWTSSAPSVGSIGNSTGTFSGIAGGGVTVTYALSNGCRAVKPVTVNALPAAISGPETVAVGGSITLGNTTGGGSWSSGNADVATVHPATGAVNGASGGVTTVTYTLPNGCYRTHPIATIASKASVGSFETTAIEEVLSVRVFPNPTSGSFTIAASKAGNAEVFAVDGKMVFRMRVEAGETSVSLPADLVNGMYTLSVITDSGESSVIRIVLNR
ncbi:MAG: Ig-like domain-containing protein [Taibaiella sp.]|nr:Ig-like domain-containing protein [Taibaiella sp.]